MSASQVSSFYRFVNIDPRDLLELRQSIEQAATRLDLLGLILIGSEGINGTISGSADGVAQFEKEICRLLNLENLEFKRSEAPQAPFARLRIKIRKEIVTLGRTDLVPTHDHPSHLSPSEWHDLLTSGREDVVVLDTRNKYETEIGKFENAICPDIKEFKEFPKFLSETKLPKDKTYLIYCTGGIRCEKAQLEMDQLGYKNVYQLRGGILKYLEEFPDQKYKGECFVFDHRLAVDQHLNTTRIYKHCPHCGQPGETQINCLRCDTETVVCDSCFKQQPHLKTCSKNCANQWKRSPVKGRRQILKQA